MNPAVSAVAPAGARVGAGARRRRVRRAPRPSPVKSTYLLEPPAPSNKGATPASATLKVGAIAGGRGRSASRTLVYRESDLKYEADFYAGIPGLAGDDDRRGDRDVACGDRHLPEPCCRPRRRSVAATSRSEAFVTELYADLRDPAHPASVLNGQSSFSAAAPPHRGPSCWNGELGARIDVASRSADALVRRIQLPP